MPRWLWALALLLLQPAHCWRPPPDPLLLPLEPPFIKLRSRRDTSATHRLQLYGWIVDLHKNNAIRSPYDDECHFYRGSVLYEDGSSVALTDCAGKMYGLIEVGGDEYVLQPTQKTGPAHVLRRRDVTLSEEMPAYNLTDDTVTDLELNFDEDDDNGSHFTSLVRRRHTEYANTEHFRDYKMGTVTRPLTGAQGLWLEMAIVADHSMVKFHGKDRVKHYILALMNIVSAIFNDPSLNSNMTLIISKLFLYEEKDTVIRFGNVKKSLESVNKWNYKHLNRLTSGSGWDATIWLTRAQLGGPSGFAPVGGVCTKTRSAALNRDEGLTSAFVIAHELAHLLGLVHDNQGQCNELASSRSVMASTVLATLHDFSWSQCSKKLFHEKSKSWWCMHERSQDEGVVLGGTKELPNYVFTMEEQCRAEFGEGFSVCKSMKLRSHCGRLWCAHHTEPLLCRSKRAPPHEGTPCGPSHWCVDRVCELMPGNEVISESMEFSDPDPSPPQWEQWSNWTDCSAHCGYGLATRNRRCKVQDSTYEEQCEGLKTEAKVCWTGSACALHRDVRADQCRRRSSTLIPYVSDENLDSCESWCVDYRGGKAFRNGILPNDSPCSYTTHHNLCYKGTCIKGQCNDLDPSCQWCPGGYCNNNTILNYRQLRRGWTRLAVIPHGAYKLRARLSLPIPLKLAIKERGKDKPLVELNKHSTKRFQIPSQDDDNLRYEADVPQNLQIIDINRRVIKEEESYGVEGRLVAAGAVLKWNQSNKEIIITSRGTFQSDFMILVIRDHKVSNDEIVAIEVSVNYSTSPIGSVRPMEYRWVAERGPCSASCGGGLQWIRSRCLRGQRCAPLRYEHCNTHRCEFTWATGEWEECSATCGDVGFQERQLFCVPINSSISNRMNLIIHSVSPALCSTSPPTRQRACNRIPCPVYWQELPWTHCSVTCGRGVSQRPLQCPAADEKLCGPRPQVRKRRCRVRRCSPSPVIQAFTCKRPDVTRYCELFAPQHLSRNCLLLPFRKYCCNACRDNDKWTALKGHR